MVHHKQSYLSCLLYFFDYYSSKEFQQRTYNLHRNTKSHNPSSFKKIQTLNFLIRVMLCFGGKSFFLTEKPKGG